MKGKGRQGGRGREQATQQQALGGDGAAGNSRCVMLTAVTDGLRRMRPGSPRALTATPRAGLQAAPGPAGSRSLQITLCLSCWAPV